MIKKWNEFIREFVESENYIDAKMQELKDLVDTATDGNNIIYEWENKDDHELTVTFSTGDLSIRYDFDIDDLHVTKTAGNNIDFQTSVESIEEGLEIIEKDIQSILGISESKKGRPKSQKYKGRKIPGKYLTKNPGAMKKEIDTFRGKKEYKKDWDADYTGGKGGEGKRVKTKKSAATKAYQRMFGKKESLTENNLLEFFYFIDKMSEKFDSESEEGSSSYIRYDFDENSDHITLEYGWSTYEEGGSEDMKIFWKENPIRVEWNEGQHTVYGDYDNQNIYKFNDFSELMYFIKEKYT